MMNSGPWVNELEDCNAIISREGQGASRFEHLVDFFVSIGGGRLRRFRRLESSPKEDMKTLRIRKLGEFMRAGRVPDWTRRQLEYALSMPCFCRSQEGRVALRIISVLFLPGELIRLLFRARVSNNSASTSDIRGIGIGEDVKMKGYPTFTQNTLIFRL
ncbi:hypothetical protein Moror_13164 [Moniliophthora roreri MCA 2997]|uniref:Uncharacterized protein n=1 Tax=Moniliophthora roreri (strain MCA 2997) TaxID=1381753 RepID=V2X937_MONRO|nr:hypothetical protein Moror_13164 [Moniliophthora roreri MCA 2997]